MPVVGLCLPCFPAIFLFEYLLIHCLPSLDVLSWYFQTIIRHISCSIKLPQLVHSRSFARKLSLRPRVHLLQHLGDNPQFLNLLFNLAMPKKISQICWSFRYSGIPLNGRPSILDQIVRRPFNLYASSSRTSHYSRLAPTKHLEGVLRLQAAQSSNAERADLCASSQSL